MQRIIKFIFFTWIISYIGLSHANTFNFQTVGSLPTTIQGGQTVIATYNVSSKGTFPAGKYHVILAALSKPANVTQDLTVANACTLNPITPAGCILQLKIVGPVSGPVKVCDDLRGKPGLNCYIPANSNDLLNVRSNLAPLLTVTPAVTFLLPNASQVFTVVNTSQTTAALNVTMTIPTNVQAELAGQPVYNGCASIAPLGSCTVTVTASATAGPGSGVATVQGSNTVTPAPTVVINTGSAPALAVSPPTTVLGPNGTQIFTVVNTSTTTAALSVTMSIPANVQSQLTGPPVYTGCASIAALGSCTIAITAVAAPSAQAAIAVVQGTNTAGPPPTVTITTGSAPALTVSPTSTILGPNGTQTFIVTNTSSGIAATSVTITIPANVQTQLVGSPVYSGCSSIAPLATCSITITANAAPLPQSGIATVQGINTALPAPTVSITTGSAPALTVSPPATVLGPNATQVFTIVNTSINIAAQNVTMTIPANVQGQLTSLPVYSGCSTIAPLGSCTVTITAIATPNAQSAIATVQGTNTAAPAPTVAITTGAAPALLVSPPSTILGPNNSQVFTVTNTSTTIAAQNVTMTIPANVQGQLSGQPVYSGCASIAALGTCTVTITAVSSPTAQSGTATVQGTNTAAPAPTVSITTGGAPALTVSPPSTVLGPNGSQQFIVVNTSTVIAALNVTISIPANVQGQLTGVPVYNGCGSIAPLGTCTITITATAAPSAQSGTASVQGTNTATPAPTVAITIGAAPVITISPPSTTLGPNGLQVFTVTNTSNSIAAQNVTMTIPANVQGQLTGPPIYSGCGSIAPLAICTITITAIATPNAQSGTASVQGTNTAAPAPTVAITTGAAPPLAVSPTTANIPFNGVQVFTVTNNGTIPANNITMSISANVQAQLVGLPIYSVGCTSLPAASSNCTITIQASAMPSSQSGTGTVQGTNTAAPAPVVTIFILPTCTVLGNTTVTNGGGTIVTGSVCVSPGTAITGFPPGQTIPAGQFHANDPIAVQDHNDANTLYNVIAGLTCGTNLSGQDLGATTLSAGVYCFNTTAAITGTLTLNGSATDKWYFQIGTTLTTAAASNIILTGGALPGNVYWQIGSSGTFGANSALQGQFVAFTSLTIGAGASDVGRLWVVNAAITLDANAIGP